MPATLYVLGNGFDLAHDLPTTYQDFFYFVETILKETSSSPLDKNIIVKDRLSSEALEYLNDGLAANPIPDDLQAIASVLSLDSYSNRNLWHSFFRKKIAEKIKLDTWIDFEKEIETAVQFFKREIFHESFYPSEMKKIYTYMGNPSFKRTGRTDSEKKLQAYEEEISKLGESSNKIDLLLLSYKTECILFLYQELQRYIFCLELYLRFFVMDHVFSNGSKHTPLAKIFEKDKPDFILSFNYTDTYYRYFDPRIDIGIQHIHGELRSKSTLNSAIKEADYLHSPLVLGFHNEEKFETSEDIQLLWFEKFYQRILCKTGTEVFSWVKDHIDVNFDINTIIYGHSLDKTDGDFIRFIFEKSSKITVYYYQETVLPRLISNLITIFDRNKVNYYYSNGILQFQPIP